MKPTTILLALVCALAWMGTARGQCCRDSLTVTFRVRNGTCADVGGRRGSAANTCTITICADGRAKVGTYCGRRPCNIFGCGCRGGCLTGEWKKSFINRNRNRRIRVLSERRNS